MRQEFYNSIIQRDQLRDNATALGETEIHNDFIDSNGNKTDGQSGRLSFDVKANPPPRQTMTQRAWVTMAADRENIEIT